MLGRFDETRGTITLTEDPAHASLEVTITTKSVSTHDVLRDDDLRTARSFDAEALLQRSVPKDVA